MSDHTPSIEKLEKQIRVLQRKLERSEWHRVDLENQHDRDQHLYRRLHADLEAARQAFEIEAALERVRSVAMAMRTPDDLSGISETVFTELKTLGFTELRNTEIIINHDTEESITSYYYSDYGVTGVVHVDYNTNPILAAWARDMQKADDAFAEVVIAEDEMEAWRAYRLSLGYVPDPKLDQATTVYYYSYSIGLGALSISSFQPVSAEQLTVLAQFRNVFNLAYQRYVDIARAEAQTREAQIEAALEKVRSRSLAVNKADEFNTVVAVVFEKLSEFDIPVTSVCIATDTEEPKDFDVFGCGESESGLITLKFGLPYFSNPFMDDIIHERSNSAMGYFSKVYTEKEKNIYYKYALKNTELKNLPDDIKQQIRKSKSYGLSTAYARKSMIMVNDMEGNILDDGQAAILKRFSRVFDQAYIRFLDLQKAEAQARQAVQQASLDRVRAEIASMRTAADLERITPLVWRELTTLGVPFFRCGVFIIDEATKYSHVYLSTPSGKSVAALPLKFDSAPVVQEAVQHWRRQQVYCETWDREQFVDWTQLILEQGLIDSPEQYQAGDTAPETLVLQFVPFTQGMLYVGSMAPLAQEEVELVQALADAFAVAYARYEDFQRLEAKNREVEAAMDELKTTQQQLIQAEKMASLGELTAGIAHEIKNPLNFVNNFAELMGELVDELKEEIDSNDGDSGAGSSHQLFEILADLKSNAEQIAKHGKRADGIVSAMMQHASGGTGQREPTDVNALLEEYVNLAYHGKRAQIEGFNCEIERNFDPAVGSVAMIPQDMGRVFLNLLSNAFDAVLEKDQPTISVQTKRMDHAIEIRVSDNGPGIPKNLLAKIFEPFFTTKPTGSGTGLGLSMSYDIVTQGHGGTLTVENEEGRGATFIVTLPVNHT